MRNSPQVVELVEVESDEELDEDLEDVDDEGITVPKEVSSDCVDENSRLVDHEVRVSRVVPKDACKSVDVVKKACKDVPREECKTVTTDEKSLISKSYCYNVWEQVCAVTTILLALLDRYGEFFILFAVLSSVLSLYGFDTLLLTHCAVSTILPVLIAMDLHESSVKEEVCNWNCVKLCCDKTVDNARRDESDHNETLYFVR